MSKIIMIQGTMSNVGKSLLTAGLCRIFHQDGLKTAPFKAQNMALNSYITADGLEIGRAQAVQAEAAGIVPTADMNPILLKPSSDTGSQLIIRGVSGKTLPARAYYRLKKTLMPVVLESFHRLEKEYDVIVIEGAGSPAEINLREDDLVNMGLAQAVQAPVLLAGDIDRGGVFAQLYGTVMLLSPEERKLVKGMIINKFRGDAALLAPGIKMLEDLCRLPVLGTVPMLPVDIDDEDSLAERLGRCTADFDPMTVDVAVIRFPRLSNFTDMHVLEITPGMQVRYVEAPGQLGNPDLLILPGTKNTIADLLWMRQNGLEKAVQKLAAAGTPVWGICGGYQMMGRLLSDPEGTENGEAGRKLAGLGLTDAETVFTPEKMRTREEGTMAVLGGFFSKLSGIPVTGYQIHMGRTILPEGTPGLTQIPEQEGFCHDRICGTYLHGIFDAPGVAGALCRVLRQEKARIRQASAEMPSLETPMDYQSWRQNQYDRLAEGLRKSLDMEKIYRILEEGACADGK